MHCSISSEQVLCLGTDISNHFEMTQCNAIDPTAFSVRTRQILSFHSPSVSFLGCNTLVIWLLGKLMCLRGPHHTQVSWACECSQKLAIPITFTVYCGCKDHHVWELSIILPKEEAELFLQIIFLCILSYAWVFWELLSFLLSLKDGLLLVSLFQRECLI